MFGGRLNGCCSVRRDGSVCGAGDVVDVGRQCMSARRMLSLMSWNCRRVSSEVSSEDITLLFWQSSGCGLMILTGLMMSIIRTGGSF